MIGGGASGCMAAIAAASAGCCVFLFEKNEKLAKKIYATGNGRCNLTNLYQDPSCYHTGAAARSSGTKEGDLSGTKGGDLSGTKEGDLSGTEEGNLSAAEEGDPSGRIFDWIRQFSQNDLISFFQRAGVPVHDRDGWVYPRTDQAQTIVRALEKRIRTLGIEVYLQACVDGIRLIENASEPQKSSKNKQARKPDTEEAAGAAPGPETAGKKGKFLLSFTMTAADALPEKNAGKNTIPGKSVGKSVRKGVGKDVGKGRKTFVKKTLICDAVIICTGGLAGPSFGCSGDGYRMAERFSHHIRRPLPALTQLVCDSPFIKRAAGVRCQVRISLYGSGSGRKPVNVTKSGPAEVETGELQITEYGISGIPVFQLSRTAARLLDAGQSVRVSINFLPEMTDAMFAEEVDRRMRLESRDQMLSDFLLGLAHRKVIDMILAADDRQAEMKAKRVPDERLHFYMEQLRGFQLQITGTRSFDSAQVTCGGIPLGEVNDDFGSVYRPGLYFAGEVLDVDGRCGGYNLQWAMTSGTLAGRAAAQ